MTLQRETISTIAPFAQEAWNDPTGGTYIEDIDVLEVKDAMTYVGQRQISEFSPEDTPVNVGSEGFGKCTGLIIRNTDTGSYTVSHLEPHADAWHSKMRTGQSKQVQWSSPHDAVLVYGSVSVRQIDIERLLPQGFWGPATLRTVNIETGGAHWGMVLYRSLGQLAVVRKKPDYSVLSYQPFEPSAS